MEFRVTLVPSPDSASEGSMLLCVNSWSLEDISDITTVFYAALDIQGGANANLIADALGIDEVSGKRVRFNISVENRRSYSVFAAPQSGEVLLSDVIVMVRRAPIVQGAPLK